MKMIFCLAVVILTITARNFAGPPDTPSNLLLVYVSQSAISVNWNVMHANSNNYLQTVFVRLISKDSGLEIDIQNKSFSPEVYNSTYNTVFQKNIQPNSNYEIRVWSINVFGQSGIGMLSVRTRNVPKLNVSSDTISINGNQATIYFTLTGDAAENITRVYAIGCSDLTGICTSSEFRGISAPNQAVITNMPNGPDYFFDLSLYRGVYQKYEYYAAMARGIKVFRDGSHGNEDAATEENKSYSTAVIVLAVLLGVAELALIGICIAYLCKEFRAKEELHEMRTRPPNGVNDRPKTEPETTGSNDVYIYEELETDNRYDNAP